MHPSFLGLFSPRILAALKHEVLATNPHGLPLRNLRNSRVRNAGIVFFRAHIVCVKKCFDVEFEIGRV